MPTDRARARSDASDVGVGSESPRPGVPERLFVRLPPPASPGDRVTLSDGRAALVETAKLADDGRDAKCVVVAEGTADSRPPRATVADERRGRARERALEKARGAKRAADARHERRAIAAALRAVPRGQCRCDLRASMTRTELADLGGGCTMPAFICPRLDAVRRRVGL